MSRNIILLFGIFIGVQSNPAPGFTRCRTDVLACLNRNSIIIYKESVAGILEQNVERQDPMYHDKIVGDLGVVKYQLRNTTVEGFKDCDLDITKFQLEKEKIEFKLTCPYMHIYGLYQISGKLLEIPIEGDGEYSMKFDKYCININSDLKIKQDGKKYFSLNNFKVVGDLKGKIILDATNLFNGQKKLGDELSKVANNNPKAVMTLLQDPVLKASMEKLFGTLNAYLNTIEVENLVQI